MGTAGGGDAEPSEGCGAGNAPASDRYGIDVEGTEREYILEVPADYDPNRPYPIVFGWHGRMYDAEWVANGEPPLTGPYFGIASEADGGAIFVAPQALETGWSNQDGRDIAFADAMLARLASELCVDQSRVFSTGFSFGAMMTIALACARADVYRAVAPMSGSLQVGCEGTELPIAYWASHGTGDTTVTPATGEAARDEFVERNGCSSTTMPTEPDGCVAFEGCNPGYPVEWCTFDGAHVPAPFAGSAIWAFFSQF